MKKFIILVCACTVLAIAAMIPLLVNGGARSAPNVTVSFLNYTNDATGTRFALFRVTNNGTEPARRLSGCHRESEIPSAYGYSHSVGSATSLRTGQSEVVRVAAPTHQT